MRRATVALALLFALAAAPAARAAIDWLDASYEKALAEAKKQGKPLLVYLYIKDSQACRLLERIVLSDPAVQKLITETYLPVRVNVFAQPHVPAELAVEPNYPTLVCVENNGKKIASICGAVEDVRFYLDFFTNVAQVRALEAAGARNGPPEQRLKLADAYYHVGQPAPALALYRELIGEQKIARDQRERIIKLAAILDRRVRGVNSDLGLLNSVLRFSRARNPSEEERQGVWKPRNEWVYEPIVFETKGGTKIGTVCRARTEKEVLEMFELIETLARQIDHPEQCDGPAAFSIAESLFKLENAEAALAFYRRALEAGGLRSADEERAEFQVGQCLSFLDRWKEAIAQLERFAQKYKSSERRAYALLIVAGCYRAWGESKNDDGLKEKAEQVLVQLVNEYARDRKYRALVDEAVGILAAWDPNINVEIRGPGG